jgi:hypothetical protein
MGCEIKTSQDGKYIIQIVSGDLTGKLALEYNLKTHALGRELGIDHYLVDVTESRNVDSPPADYSFAHFSMKNNPAIDQTARVAILIRPGDRSHNFIETVSRNSGLDVTIFTDRYQAIRHLTKD